MASEGAARYRGAEEERWVPTVKRESRVSRERMSRMVERSRIAIADRQTGCNWLADDRSKRKNELNGREKRA